MAHRSMGPGSHGKGPCVAGGVEFDRPAEIGQRLLMPLHGLVGLASMGDGPVQAGVEFDRTGESASASSYRSMDW